MTITSGKQSDAAFIGHMAYGGTLKNITFENASVTGTDAAAIAVEMISYGGAYIEGVTVKDATLNGHHWVGGILGYGYPSYVKDCTVSGLTLNCTYLNDDSDGDKAGAIVGIIASDSNGKLINCHATDCTVNAVRDAGQLAGALKATSIENCSATNVTVTGTGANVRNEFIGRVF